MSSVPIPSSSAKPANSSTIANLNAFASPIVGALGSLKITVTCFALAIFVTLTGTLALVGKDIWEVLEIYFRSWITWVDTSVFFPKTWAPEMTTSEASMWFALACILFGGAGAALSYANRATFKWGIPAAISIAVVALCLAASAQLTNGFYSPGGATIGAVMCVNLLAAHLTRYRIQAKGTKRTIGFAVTLFGIILTAVVIAQGHNSDGFQGQPPFAWTTLWSWVKIGVSFAALGLIVLGSVKSFSRRFVRPAVLVTGVLVGLLSIWLWASGSDVYIGDSGMRVMWNLIIATAAGVVLLAGLIPLFGQRAGVVLLHGGVGLLMFGQWFVSQYDVEEQMTMAEGQTINYGQDIRAVELAVIRPEAAEFDGKDDVFAIPMSNNGRLTRFAKSDSVETDELPFKIKVIDYKKSSGVRMADKSDDLIADSGKNAGYVTVDAKAATGAAGSDVDLASGYFQLIDKKTDKPIGTYLLSQSGLEMRGGRFLSFDTETVEAGNAEYKLQLRFKRNYKDYSMQLVNVQKDDYLGTNIPRNYASDVKLVDPKRNTNQEITIWMNNPRRYAGETFYQSGYQEDMAGNEYTTLQVVRNQGWMIPYVACMICFVGMFYHFFNVLTRFLDRRSRSEQEAGTSSESSISRYVVPFVVVACFVILVGRATKAPSVEDGEMDLYAFGELPLVYEGRVKPFDTLARNSLKVISDGETFKGVLPPKELAQAWPEAKQKILEKYEAVTEEDIAKLSREANEATGTQDNPEFDGDVDALIDLIVKKTDGDEFAVTKFVHKELYRRQSAVRWLLDLVSGSPNARRHRVVRIYHPQVLGLMGLKERKGYRYSLQELMVNIDKFEEQLEMIREAKRNDETLDLYQKKVVELSTKLDLIFLLNRAFSPPNLPELPTPDEFSNNHTVAMQKVQAFRQAMIAMESSFERSQPPLAVAPTDDEEWEAYAASWPKQALLIQLLGQEPKPSFVALNTIILSYLNGNVEGFNTAVYDYKSQLLKEPPKELIATPSATNSYITEKFGSFYAFESFFNRAAPFLMCCITYLMAFLVLCIGFFRASRTMYRVAFWMIVCTFVIHTIALAGRVYISGRPPVTNLYSSAVFIGWIMILLALFVELLLKNGLASLAATVGGFTTLLIAHKLTGDGDTIKVLQAVLDTQFWLATHVVTITLGYATTLFAGLLGVVYVIGGLFTDRITKKTGDALAKATYGVLCFAIFFSFIGTVLGGLWADDSWGRFWGWDPKENGALIIVLWNALILHAKWDRLIGNRGLAVLAIAGNIVTAWSWFGVNELGEGLHSYGFTEGRLVTLAWFVASQLAMIVIGLLPLHWWSSYRDSQGPTAA